MLKKCREIVDGILLIDKPIGISSNSALQEAKHLFNAQKAGHTGSLDPLASGMLPICFGEATKYSRFLLEEKKCYQTVMQLGVTTTTGDGEGDVVNREPIPILTEELLAQMLSRFQGQLQQIPPMYSAIKFQGQPLYKLARQGKEIERQSRQITVYGLQIDEIDAQKGCISLTIECSTGTYIRTLVEDMGSFLGCGAHVIALRRLWVWPFNQHEMFNFDDLTRLSQPSLLSMLLPLQTVLTAILPTLKVTNMAASLLQKGQIIPFQEQSKPGWAALLTLSGEFIGVGEVLEDGRVAPRRLLQQKDAVCV
ncbi:MAG: tRNA pseudouridine(55) synthase TruB [Gammaproteobacteria bacterium]|jgi:tRNA pseudouridine55 synthase|nr:tRNA pseudouridine(55) synthase TruB [Gammaproteobacteria bacterium]